MEVPKVVVDGSACYRPRALGKSSRNNDSHSDRSESKFIILFSTNCEVVPSPPFCAHTLIRIPHGMCQLRLRI